jgi:TPR repeat protein
MSDSDSDSSVPARGRWACVSDDEPQSPVSPDQSYDVTSEKAAEKLYQKGLQERYEADYDDHDMEAATFFKMAAAADHDHAHYELALMYERELGVDQDHKEAFRCAHGTARLVPRARNRNAPRPP